MHASFQLSYFAPYWQVTKESSSFLLFVMGRACSFKFTLSSLHSQCSKRFAFTCGTKLNVLNFENFFLAIRSEQRHLFTPEPFFCDEFKIVIYTILFHFKIYHRPHKNWEERYKRCWWNHWCRKRGCNRTPKTFDLMKIRANFLKIRAKSVEIWAKYMKTFEKLLCVLWFYKNGTQN